MGDAGLHPGGILFLTVFIRLNVAEEERVWRVFLLVDLVCVLSALSQRNYEFHDLKSTNFGDSVGHILINCPFGMKDLLFKLLQENFLSTEKSAVWLF